MKITDNNILLTNFRVYFLLHLNEYQVITRPTGFILLTDFLTLGKDQKVCSESYTWDYTDRGKKDKRIHRNVTSVGCRMVVIYHLNIFLHFAGSK